MAVTLAGNALTTITALEAELGISAGAEDSYLSKLINRVSSFIENACNRSFAYKATTDEAVAGYGSKRIFIDITPLLTITELKYDETVIDSDDYEIDGTGATGGIYSVGGLWNSTARNLANIDYNLKPGSERLLYYVSYTGGYVLPRDAVQGSVVGTETETFAFGTNQDLVVVTDFGTTTTTIPTAGTPHTATVIKALIDAAITATGYGDFTCDDTGGIITLTTVGNDSSNYVQVTAGTAATTLGLDSTKHSGTRTLPWDLESLCLDISVREYRRKGQDKSIKSEKLLSASQTYNSSGMDSMSSATIAKYERITFA